MNLVSLGLIIVIGLFFWGGWGMVAKSSDIGDPFVRGFLVNAITAIGFVPFLRGKLSTTVLNSRGAVILLAAGLLNFAGHALYPKLQTYAGNQISVYNTLISALCILAGITGGFLFYGESITPAKAIFALCILVGVVGLAFTSLQ